MRPPRSWNPLTDIPWKLQEELDRLDLGKIPGSYFYFLRQDRLWTSLSGGQRRKLSLEMLDWTLAQLLYGEQLSRDICRAISRRREVPADARRMAALQLREEERHCRAFRLYRARLLRRSGRPAFADASLKFRRLLESQTSWELQLLGLQVVGEGLFLKSLLRLRRAGAGPVLRRLLALVIGDEARHRRHGVAFMKKYLGSRPDLRRRRAQAFALAACRTLVGGFPSAVWQRAGVDPAPYRKAHAARLGRGGQALYFAGLFPVLEKLGLLPRRLRAHYAALELL